MSGRLVTTALAILIVSSSANSQPDVARVSLEFGENRVPILFNGGLGSDQINSIRIDNLPGWVCDQSASLNPLAGRGWSLNLDVCSYSSQFEVLDVLITTGTGEEWKAKLRVNSPEPEVSTLATVIPTHLTVL